MVEDSAFLAELIEDMLTEAGATVVGWASSVDAALNELRDGASISSASTSCSVRAELRGRRRPHRAAYPFRVRDRVRCQNRARAAPPAAADRQDGSGGPARPDMLCGAGLGRSAGLILIARHTPSGQAGRLEPQLTSSPRKAQRVMRFSTRAQIAYISTPMMAMANRPAKVVGASCARWPTTSESRCRCCRPPSRKSPSR